MNQYRCIAVCAIKEPGAKQIKPQCCVVRDFRGDAVTG